MKQILFHVTAADSCSSMPAFAALKPNDTAPDFPSDRSSRKSFRSRTLAGRGIRKARGVILSFFASWCQPCRNELPLLEFAGRGVERKGHQRRDHRCERISKRIESASEGAEGGKTGRFERRERKVTRAVPGAFSSHHILYRIETAQ